jgi:hypothetical protein
MKVSVQYLDQSQPMNYENVDNTYMKGNMFCVKIGEKVYKHPIQQIWRITEEYGEHQ